jgi:hypothetical protein
LFRGALVLVWAIAWCGCAAGQNLVSLIGDHIECEWSGCPPVAAYPSDIREALRRHGVDDDAGAIEALARNQSPTVSLRYQIAQERLKDGFWSVVVRGKVQVPSSCQMARTYIEKQTQNAQLGLASVRAASLAYQRQNYFLGLTELLDGATFFPAADATAATNAYRACFDTRSPERLFKSVEQALGSKSK